MDCITVIKIFFNYYLDQEPSPHKHKRTLKKNLPIQQLTCTKPSLSSVLCTTTGEMTTSVGGRSFKYYKPHGGRTPSTW